MLKPNLHHETKLNYFNMFAFSNKEFTNWVIFYTFCNWIIFLIKSHMLLHTKTLCRSKTNHQKLVIMYWICISLDKTVLLRVIFFLCVKIIYSNWYWNTGPVHQNIIHVYIYLFIYIHKHIIKLNFCLGEIGKAGLP